MKRRTRRNTRKRKTRKRRTRRNTRKRKTKKGRSKKRRLKRRSKRGGTCNTLIDRKRGETKNQCMRRKFLECKSRKKTIYDGNPDHHHINCLESYPNTHPDTKKEWMELSKTWVSEPGKYDDYGNLKKGHKQWHASDSEL